MTALQATTDLERTTARASFRVDSHCRQCAATLEQALRTTDGVCFAVVLPVSSETVIDYDPTLLAPSDLQEAIEGAGCHVEFLGTRRVVRVTNRSRGQTR